MKSQVNTIVLASALLALMITVSIQGIEAKTYSGHSYSFTYPNGCKPDKDQNKYSDSITLKCKEDMMIQLNAGGITGNDLSTSTEDSLADDLTTLFSTNGGWQDVNEVERGNLTVGNTSAPFVIATYTQTYTGFLGLPADREEDFVAQIIAIKTNDGYVVGQYKNNAGDFDKGKSIAEKIFTSVTPKANGTNQNNNGQSAYERCQSESQDQYENLRDTCGDQT
jgi:hypothetical protein